MRMRGAGRAGGSVAAPLPTEGLNSASHCEIEKEPGENEEEVEDEGVHDEGEQDETRAEFREVLCL